MKFVNNVIEDLAVQVSLNPDTEEGLVVYNLSLIRNEDLDTVTALVKDAFKSGITFSGYVKFVESGEQFCGHKIRQGCTGYFSICSTTLDGVLVRKGIPLTPIGGGVLEVEKRKPTRFIHMILYKATTIDPLQVLTAQGVTRILDVMYTSNGNILANIRECHMEAEPQITQTLEEMSDSGFPGIIELGAPNTPLLGVSISTDFLGVVAAGGTNPMAAIKEKGMWLETQAMKGLVDVKSMDWIEDF